MPTSKIFSPTSFMNNEGVIMDLETAFGRIPDNGSLSLVSPCSLLVKIAQNDVLFGHNSWTSYRSMLRIQKKYSFPYQLYPGSCEYAIGVIKFYRLVLKCLLETAVTELPIYRRVCNQFALHNVHGCSRFPQLSACRDTRSRCLRTQQNWTRSMIFT